MRIADRFLPRSPNWYKDWHAGNPEKTLRRLCCEDYPGGTGLMSGSVFGKLAGESAAAYVGAQPWKSAA